LPVEQPDPPDCATIGLKNGSRFPVIEYFFSSGLPCLDASAVLPAGVFAASGAVFSAPVADGFETFAVAGTLLAPAFAFEAGAAAAGGLGANTALVSGLEAFGAV
jgi:hypothetical protein